MRHAEGRAIFQGLEIHENAVLSCSDRRVRPEPQKAESQMIDTRISARSLFLALAAASKE